MSEERLQILKMIESGQITAEEGTKLLAAVDESEPEKVLGVKPAQWIRVRVRDGENTKVNVNLPMALLEVAVNLALKFAPPSEEIEKLNLQEIMASIKKGARGKLVEVEDGDTTVEVIIE